MLGKVGAKIKTTVRHPSLLPLYARWITLGGAAGQRVMRIQGMKIAGFSTFLGAWRHRPTAAECTYMAQAIAPGDIVVDVGANFGIMAMTMARLSGPSGRVVAFEPVSNTFSALETNVRRNDIGWIECVESAVGAAPGTISFTDSSDPATNRISDTGDVLVSLCTLDQFFAQQSIDRIAFLKVDVEGAELDVISGAQSLLERHTIHAGMIEVCPGTLARFGKTPEQLFDALAGYGYVLSWIEDPDTPLTRGSFRNLPHDFLGNAAFRVNERANSA